MSGNSGFRFCLLFGMSVFFCHCFEINAWGQVIGITPTPVKVFPTPTPTSTPTLVPKPFNMAVSGVVLNTTAVIHSVEGMDAIRGDYTLTLSNATSRSIPVEFTFRLRDSNDAIIKNWTQEAAILLASTSERFVKTYSFSFPISVEDALPLDSMLIEVGAFLDSKQTGGGVFGSSAEIDIDDNHSRSDAHPFLHTSGVVRFNNISTVVTHTDRFLLDPLRVFGYGTWNALTHIFCYRSPVVASL